MRLEYTRLKDGISLAGPYPPKGILQPVPSMLRIRHVYPIWSCSKASGVFSSTCRKPASSPVLYFHQADPWDSSQVITPFVHVGIYPTRNYALLSLKKDSCFIYSCELRCMTFGLLGSVSRERYAFPYLSRRAPNGCSAFLDKLSHVASTLL
jgi:hypothetical protein